SRTTTRRLETTHRRALTRSRMAHACASSVAPRSEWDTKRDRPRDPSWLRNAKAREPLAHPAASYPPQGGLGTWRRPPETPTRACRPIDKGMETIEVALSRLAEAPWNANRLPAPLLLKLERSISQFGTVQNLVARPHTDGSDRFEVLSGNQRLRVYRELGVE